ncbi:MAG: hypothetical protein ACE147_10040 [Candidatus Methylomirabilales bacterium]
MTPLRLASHMRVDQCPTPNAPAEDVSSQRATRVETRVHQRQCERCQRWFWPWDASREKCYVCQPLPPDRLKHVLEGIHGAARPAADAAEPELLALSAR